MGTGSSKAPRPSTHQLAAFTLHTAPINCLACNAEASVLITGSDDCTARIWSVEPTECVGVLTGHTEYLSCISLLDYIAFTGSADCSIRKWNIQSCECLAVFDGHERLVNRLVISPVTMLLFSCSYDFSVRAWNVENETGEGACVRVFTGHTKAIFPLLLVPDCDGVELVISGGFDGIAISWDVQQGQQLVRFEGHTGGIQCMTASSDAQTLVTGSADFTVRSWNISTGETLQTFEGHKASVVSVSLTPKFLYTGSVDKTARSWMLEFGTLNRIFRGHNHTVSFVIYKMPIFVTVCGDGGVRIFDSRSGMQMRHYRGHTMGITGAKLCGDKLFTGSSDGSLRVWSLRGLLTSLDDDDAGLTVNNSQLMTGHREYVRLSQVKNYIPRNEAVAPEVIINHNPTQIFIDQHHVKREEEVEDEEEE